MSGLIGRVEARLRAWAELLRKLLRVSLWPIRSPGQASQVELRLGELTVAARSAAGMVDEQRLGDPVVDEVSHEHACHFPSGLEVWSIRMDGSTTALRTDLGAVERAAAVLAEQEQLLASLRAEIEGWVTLLPEESHG